MRKGKPAAAAATGWAGGLALSRAGAPKARRQPGWVARTLPRCQAPPTTAAPSLRPHSLGFWTESPLCRRSEPGRVRRHRCVRAGQGLGTGFCLASHTLCSALRSLTWRQGKRNLRRWPPAVFVVAHLLINRYKLLILETLAAPLLIKPLQLIIIFSLESLRGKQRRRHGRLPFLLEARCPGHPGSHALGPGQQPELWEKQRGSRLRRAKTRAP